MSKRLLSIIALALVLGVGIFYFWKHETAVAPTVIPSPQPEATDQKKIAEDYARNWDGTTDNWKVYMNDEFGFVLRYPEEVFTPRISPVSGGVGVYSHPLPPKEFRITLTQNGYSEDDYKHQIWMNLNSLKSDKEYYSEAQKDTATTLVPFGSKSGKIYGTKETILKQKSSFESFLRNGTCDSETLTVIFDDVASPNGDVRSYVHVGCEGNDMGRIYKAIYQSVRFF